LRYIVFALREENIAFYDVHANKMIVFTPFTRLKNAYVWNKKNKKYHSFCKVTALLVTSF